MNGFQARLRTAINGSKYSKSLRSLSQASDCGEKWVSNLLTNRELEMSKSGPGFFAIARLAQTLNISLDQLSGRFEFDADSRNKAQIGRLAKLAIDSSDVIQSGSAPSPQALLRLYARSGARIEAFNAYLRFADIYRPIESINDELKVIKVGSESLAAVTMHTDDAAILQDALDGLLNTELIESTKSAHLACKQHGAFSVIKQLDNQMPNQPIRVRMDYISTYLHVSDSTGQQSTLHFASLLL